MKQINAMYLKHCFLSCDLWRFCNDHVSFIHH